MQKADVRPDPGQYEGMHTAVRFPAHERGTLFDAPPVEPLLAPSHRTLEAIVATFLSPAPAPATRLPSTAGKIPSKIPGRAGSARRKAGVAVTGQSPADRHRKSTVNGKRRL